jgi:hypothetical protein
MSKNLSGVPLKCLDAYLLSAFVERYFRLRGNLLFYFKDKNFVSLFFTVLVLSYIETVNGNFEVVLAR